MELALFILSLIALLVAISFLIGLIWKWKTNSFESKILLFISSIATLALSIPRLILEILTGREYVSVLIVLICYSIYSIYTAFDIGRYIERRNSPFGFSIHIINHIIDCDKENSEGDE